MKRSFLIALLSLSVGCASTSPKEPYDQSAAAIEARTGVRVHWNQGTQQDEDVARRVHELLQHELQPETAVQIALVNNPSLQATFEELRIAQADLVQAGLLKNPTFGGAILFPIKGTPAEPDPLRDVQLNVVEDFLDVFMIPARKRIARAELEAAKLRVGDVAVKLAAEVRGAYYRAVGAQQVLQMRRTVIEASETAVDLAQRQYEAGNISELDLTTQQAMYAQLRLDLARSEAEVFDAHEALTRLMGVWGPDTEWKPAAKLPDLPSLDPGLERLESLAIGRRFDLASAHHEAESISETLAMVKNWRWIDGGNVGATYARTHEGPVLIGPTAAIGLPIFDQKQAVIARLEGFLHQARAREAALAIDIRSEVRTARARLTFTRGVIRDFAARIVPLRERIVALSQERYNAMLLGVYELILAKQNEVNAYRDLIDAARDYWVARADLERAVGGRLEPGAAPTKTDGSKKN